MSRKTKYPQLKYELKELAKKIRFWKSKRKLKNREHYSLSDIHSDLHHLRRKFRHKHIAYCELNGTERFRIEQPYWKNSFNKPDENYIEQIKNEHRPKEKVFKRNMEI